MLILSSLASFVKMLMFSMIFPKKGTTLALSIIRRTSAFVPNNHRGSSIVCRKKNIQNTFIPSIERNKVSNCYKRNNSLFLSTLDNASSEDSTSSATTNITSTLELSVTNVEDLEDTGSILSIDTTSGDIIFLDGDLGAGKTCLSRGFIRAKIHDFDTLVTSPTYLLSNTYVAEEENITIHHMDFYRLSDHATDFQPLNLPYVFQNCISLIEWPNKLKCSNCSDLIPNEYLDIQIKIQENNPNVRLISITPIGRKWESRIQFLIDEGYFDDLIVL